MPNAIGQRGKWAEGRVRLFLKGQEASQDAAFHRFPDARAGSMQVTPCDFMFIKAGKLYLIEVKEVDHACRLPHKNFSPDKVARMRMWQLAGATCNVVIYFEPTKLWLVVDLRVFLTREGGSWNFSGNAMLSEAQARELMIR